MTNQTQDLIALQQLTYEIFSHRMGKSNKHNNRIPLKSLELISFAAVALANAVRNEQNVGEINSLRGEVNVDY